MKINFSYNPAKDAENYVWSVFKFSHISHGYVNLRDILLSGITNEKVRGFIENGKDVDEVRNNITDALGSDPERTEWENKAVQLSESWNELGDQIVFTLESLYGMDNPFDEVTVDLTTLPICPYNFKERQIYVSAKPSVQFQLRILLHELNHFFFYWKYAKDYSEKLGKEKFELLKESMTIFTNPEQKGKPNEEPLRKHFIENKVRIIDDVVKLGAEFLLSNS